jgi:hypothetical protein
LDEWEVFNEVEHHWKLSEDARFTMKGILDRVVVDHDEKSVWLIDLKTTSKSVYSFQKSYVQYNYHRQIALYSAGVMNLLQEKGVKVEGYSLQVIIVAVQTTGQYECAFYRPSKSSLEKGREEVEALLQKLEWHFDNDLWDYPREYYEGDGTLTLEIDDGDSND